jgi:hypothetical protein
MDKAMGIEIVLRWSDFPGVWVTHIGQPLQLTGVILSCAPSSLQSIYSDHYSGSQVE